MKYSTPTPYVFTMATNKRVKNSTVNNVRFIFFLLSVSRSDVIVTTTKSRLI